MKKEYIIILAITCYFLADSFYAPTIALIAGEFNTSSTFLKSTMSAFQIGAFISCLIALFFADYFGKIRFMCAGIVLTILGSLICMMSTSVEVLIIGRFIQGAGAASGYMVGFALAVDLFDDKTTLKIITFSGFAIAIISIFAPYIGGAIAGYSSWRLIFLLMVLLSSFTLFFLILKLPMDKLHGNVPFRMNHCVEKIAQLILSFRYMSYACVNPLFLITLFFSLTFLPFYLGGQLGLSSHAIGAFIGISIWLPFASANYISSRLYALWGTNQTIYGALVISAVGVICIWVTSAYFASSLVAIAASLVLFNIGYGCLFSGAISQSFNVFPEISTIASAFRAILVSAGAFVGSFSAQNVNDQMLGNLGIVMLVTVVLVTTLFYLGNKMTGA